MPAAIPVTINGTTYPTTKHAYTALGIPKPIFLKLRVSDNIDQAVHDYFHPYGRHFSYFHPTLNIAMASIARRELMYRKVEGLFAKKTHGTLITSISEYVISGNSKVAWACIDCDTRHEMFAELLVRRESGCGVCSRSVKDPNGFESVKAIISQRDGQLLGPMHYVNRFFKYEIKCNNGHLFKLSANEHINKQRWCSKCGERPGEMIARHILENLLDCELDGPLRGFEWMKRHTGMNLELDGYCPAAKINGITKQVAFEYQGKQHYEPHWKGNLDGLLSLQKKDRLKFEACNAEGLILVVVPYFAESANFEEKVEHVKQTLREYGIAFNRREVPYLPIKAKSSKVDELRALLNDRGYELKSTEYLGYHGKYEVYCPIHQHTWLARYSGLVDKTRKPNGCPKCGIESTIAASRMRKKTGSQDSKGSL